MLAAYLQGADSLVLAVENTGEGVALRADGSPLAAGQINRCCVIDLEICAAIANAAVDVLSKFYKVINTFDDVRARIGALAPAVARKVPRQGQPGRSLLPFRLLARNGIRHKLLLINRIRDFCRGLLREGLIFLRVDIPCFVVHDDWLVGSHRLSNRRCRNG